MPRIVKFLALIFVLVSCIDKRAHGQVFQNEIYKEMGKKIALYNYPESLRQLCSPIFTGILYKVNSNGVIDTVMQSDNAPQEFKIKFEKTIKTIDKALIQRFVTYKSLKNCGVLLPVTVIFENDSCKLTVSQQLQNKKSYNVFGGKHLDKLTYDFDPFIITVFQTISDHHVH